LNKISRIAHLGRLARQAKAESGHPIIKQVRDIMKLRRAPNLVQPEEYFAMKLYELPEAEQQTFLGAYNDGVVNYMVASPLWIGIARDKLLFHNIFASLGYRLPHIQLLYTPTHRSCVGATLAENAESLAEGIRHLHPPVFAKPLGGDLGLGVRHIVSIDAAGDCVVLLSGEKVAIPELSRQIVEAGLGGYVFQDIIRNAPEMREMFGEELVSMRACVVREDGVYRLLRAWLKVRIAGNITDNWDHGRHGNGVAVLDEDSGMIKDILTGEYPNVEHGELHPGTGEQLVGRAVPRWMEIRAYVERAARELPSFTIQHWDIVLSDQGPLILELNEDQSLHALQGMGRRGLLDDRFSAVLAAHGHDLRSLNTQEFMRQVAGIMSKAYGMDNALMGKGTFYMPATRL